MIPSGLRTFRLQVYAGCSIVKTPLVTIGYESSYDVFLLSWQARAISSGLAPALLKVSDSHRSPLKQESLPTRDARVDWVVKRKKTGLRKARKRPPVLKTLRAKPLTNCFLWPSARTIRQPHLAFICLPGSVLLATASVILLALFSPLPHRKVHKTPQLALSFYIQQPQVGGSSTHPAPPKAGALIFHRMLTEGPENTSRVVGKAQGFIIPVESFAYSAFNIIYLTFHTHEYSGSISIQAKNFGHKETEELAVVGGTGSFSFARGLAVFAETNRQTPNLDATYVIKLHLKFPNRSQTIPG
ncbi:UNVERIFIED_CONTAM: 30S ribosomal protein S9, chloroplastic [Sesamum latifolium]|uniref:Dirigent protein n=1 Tax=Sesamum latifolium TaxID=2727402 RepID=A0AAW2VTB0_9LAMI